MSLENCSNLNFVTLALLGLNFSFFHLQQLHTDVSPVFAVLVFHAEECIFV